MEPRDILGAARIRVWNEHPYLMEVLFKLKPVETDKIPTLAVDAGLRLYYNPDFVVKSGVQSLPTVLAHEVQHIIRAHPARGEAVERSVYAARYARVAKSLAEKHGIQSLQHLLNICADAEINDDLEHAAWPKDAPPVLPRKYGLPNGVTMEEALASLIESAEQSNDEQSKQPQPDPQGSPQQSQSGEQPGKPDNADSQQSSGSSPEQSEEPSGTVAAGCCGSCCGNKAPVESQVEGLPEPTTPDELEIAKRQVAHAVLEAKARGAQAADWLVAWSKSQFAKPKVDWRKVLATQVRGAVASARGNTDWKIGPPSRRRSVLEAIGFGDEAPILPVLRGPEPKVAFVLDTSGSMSTGEGSLLDKAITEAHGLVKSLRCSVYGMACDSSAKSQLKPVSKPADIMALAVGGGGTDMRVGIKAAAESKVRPDVIVLLTDGETPWPTPSEMPRKSRLIVCVIQSRWSVDIPGHIARNTIKVGGANV